MQQDLAHLPAARKYIILVNFIPSSVGNGAGSYPNGNRKEAGMWQIDTPILMIQHLRLLARTLQSC